MNKILIIITGSIAASRCEKIINQLINKKITNTRLNENNKDVSPPFYENMMSLIYMKKIDK